MTKEWGVKWEAIGAFREEVHAKKSREVAEETLERSAFPGVVVCREVTDWEVPA